MNFTGISVLVLEINKITCVLCYITSHIFLYEQIFIEMLRKKRQKRYEELCEKELKRLDDRIDAGEPLEATIQLSLLKRKSKL